MRGKIVKELTIYTDGACSGNPGPGGWGAIMIYGSFRKEISGGGMRIMWAGLTFSYTSWHDRIAYTHRKH